MTMLEITGEYTESTGFSVFKEGTTESLGGTGDEERGMSIYFRIADVLIQYATGVLLAVGTVGNLLSLVIMTRPSMRRQSTSLYLSTLAISDMACLVFISAEFWYNNEPFCHVNGMLLSGSTTCSGLLILMVTAERVVVVWFPLRASSWLLRKWARIIVAALTVLSYGMYMPRVVYTSEEIRCNPKQPYKDVYFIQVVTFYSCVPIILLLVLNTAIVIKLNIRSDILQDTTPQGPKTIAIRKATWLVVTVSTSYILMILPSVSTIVYQKITGSHVFADPGLEVLWTVISYHMLMTNHSVNFWLYVFVSAKFRSALRRLFVCARGLDLGSGNSDVTMKGITTVQTPISAVQVSVNAI